MEDHKKVISSVSQFLGEEAQIAQVLQQDILLDQPHCTEHRFGAQPAHAGRTEQSAQNRRLQSCSRTKHKIGILKRIARLYFENT